MKIVIIATITSLSLLASSSSANANELERKLGLRKAYKYCGMLSANIPTASPANQYYREYMKLGCKDIVDKYVESNPFAYNDYVDQYGLDKVAKECKKIKSWFEEFSVFNIYREEYHEMECDKVLEAVEQGYSPI